MRWDIGIDLGTESVRMADGKQGPFKESAAALAFREGRRHAGLPEATRRKSWKAAFARALRFSAR